MQDLCVHLVYILGSCCEAGYFIRSITSSMYSWQVEDLRRCPPTASLSCILSSWWHANLRVLGTFNFILVWDCAGEPRKTTLPLFTGKSLYRVTFFFLQWAPSKSKILWVSPKKTLFTSNSEIKLVILKGAPVKKSPVVIEIWLKNLTWTFDWCTTAF